MEFEDIWEYSIFFKNGDEFFTENENELNIVREDNENEIENIYYKQYVYNEYTKDYEEQECIVIK